MIVHTLDGNEFPNPSKISISEQDNECVIIINDLYNDRAEITLDLSRLHSFIGTLLHVQQKLKNK